jgi:hypothetical protein
VRSPKRSTRFRVTRNLIIASAAVAALTAGAIVVALESNDIRGSNAACYPTASLDGTPYNVLGEPGAALADPTVLCEVVWANNLWDESTNDDPDPSDGTFPVPPLTACTGADGIAAVFPLEGSAASEEDFCETLGLADWSSD